VTAVRSLLVAVLVRRTFVEFMRHAHADREYPALWFAFLNSLLETTRAGGRSLR
jgi:hypothetical protein